MISIRFAACGASPYASVLAVGLISATILGGAGTVYAADCNTDLASLGQKRQIYIDKLNVLAKAAKGKLDPVASCPTLRGLVAAEGALIKYLEANKNWCNVPDNVLTTLKTNDVKSQTFATQACTLATQMKKQKEQAAAGGSSLGIEAQKLPTGPL